MNFVSLFPLTWCQKVQLLTNNSCFFITPVITTSISPNAVMANLDIPFSVRHSSNKTNLSLSTISLGYKQNENFPWYTKCNQSWSMKEFDCYKIILFQKHLAGIFLPLLCKKFCDLAQSGSHPFILDNHYISIVQYHMIFTKDIHKGLLCAQHETSFPYTLTWVADGLGYFC